MENSVKIGKYNDITIPDNLDGAELDSIVVGQIMQNSDAIIPKMQIRERAIGMFEQFDIKLSQQGLSIDEYYAKADTDKEKLMSGFMHHAERQIKERKVLLQIAELEGISSTREEYLQYLDKLGKIYPLPSEKLCSILDGEEKEKIMEQITLRKTIDYIIKINKKQKG